MASIGFLGCGKIGKAMLEHIQRNANHSIAFVQDPLFDEGHAKGFPIVSELNEDLCKADLVVECATADALKQSFKHYLRHGDLMVFSLTAESRPAPVSAGRALCLLRLQTSCQIGVVAGTCPRRPCGGCQRSPSRFAVAMQTTENNQHSVEKTRFASKLLIG